LGSQPSLSTKFPSSHVSPDSTTLFPHTAGELVEVGVEEEVVDPGVDATGTQGGVAQVPGQSVQTEGVEEVPEVHEYPVAQSPHPVAHPIPLFDPSSHFSVPATFPSPQVVTQTDGAPVQVHPGSRAHIAEHPSPPLLFLSSQGSEPINFPSPQYPVQMLDAAGPPQQQTHPVAKLTFLQFAVHPPVVKPSSQTSVPTTKESPQIDVHIVGIAAVHDQPASF